MFLEERDTGYPNLRKATVRGRRTVSDEQQDDSHAKAEQEMRELEQADEIPQDPTDWPGGKAKYVTFGGDSDEPYGEGPTSKLGPAEVTHNADGSVSVGGEEVDDPSKYKGEKITSGVIEQIERSKQTAREHDGDGSDGANAGDA